MVLHFEAVGQPSTSAVYSIASDAKVTELRVPSVIAKFRSKIFGFSMQVFSIPNFTRSENVIDRCLPQLISAHFISSSDPCLSTWNLFGRLYQWKWSLVNHTVCKLRDMKYFGINMFSMTKPSKGLHGIRKTSRVMKFQRMSDLMLCKVA